MLRTSVEIAVMQGTRSEQLLSALALGRLALQSRDDMSEAQNILVSAFEGFACETEFPAVVEAQLLLAELGRALQ